MTALYCPSRPTLIPNIDVGVAAIVTLTNPSRITARVVSGNRVTLQILDTAAETTGLSSPEFLTPAELVDGVIEQLPRAE